MALVDTIDRAGVARVCRARGARRLLAFGSATTDRFHPGSSDVDFLVEFDTTASDAFESFFGLKEDLEALLGMPVDLVDNRAVRNPFFARQARSQAVEVYAA